MVEIRRILCPCDFSGYSGRALRQARRLADRLGARLTVLHVIPSTLAGSGAFAPLTNPALLFPDSHERALAALRQFVGHAESGGLPPDVEVRAGAPAPQILARAGELSADLVVMGTHGRGGFERWTVGSVTERVLRRAGCAVLTVPARGRLPEGPALFDTVLWATDFSAAADVALDYAVVLARPDRARLLLVHVLAHSQEPEATADAFPKPRDPIRDRLREAACAEVRNDFALEEIVAVGKPPREIARIAAERRVALIALGAQGADALDSLVFGSTAQRVLRTSPCPVLVARAS